jgi:hypothetical protein
MFSGGIVMTVKCKRCHRVLKNPASITHGYGSTCWKKVKKEVENELSDKDNLPKVSQ